MSLLWQDFYFKKRGLLTHILRLLLVVVAILITPVKFAEAIAPVASSLEPDIRSDRNFSLKINIEDGWKLYGPYPGDDGLPLKISSDGSYNLVDLKIMWPDPIRLAGAVKGNNIYQGKVDIPLLASALDPADKIKLNLTLRMVVCKDVCMPFTQTLYAEGGALGGDGKHTSLLMMMLFALMGGFILNLMPCVLPVVTLKAYSIVKYSGKSEAHIRLSALLTVFGIVATFLSLALIVVGVRAAGGYIGWGFHFQQPSFLITLAIILFISVMVLREEVAISLPYITPSNGDYNNHMASFLSGVLTTLLATPCTAPFITPVVAFALTQDVAIIILLYCSIGLGMAVPFLLLSIWPGATKVLPKPGAWMGHLKVIFSFFMILTVVWLLYILLGQIGSRAVILISGCLILLKFFLTSMPSWKGIVMAGVIAIFMVSSPRMIHRHDVAQAQLVNQYWEPFSQERLDQYIEHGDVVLVDVTADWCLLCKVNKLFIMDNVAILEFFQMRGVKMMRADLTSPSKDIMQYMKINDREAIPFNVVYGPKPPFRIILPEILTSGDIKNAVNEVQK